MYLHPDKEKSYVAAPGRFLCSSKEILGNLGRVTSSEVARSGSHSNRLAQAPFQRAGSKRLWETVQTQVTKPCGLEAEISTQVETAQPLRLSLCELVKRWSRSSCRIKRLKKQV